MVLKQRTVMLASVWLALTGTTGLAQEFAIQSLDAANMRIMFNSVEGATNYSVQTAPTCTGTWSVAVGAIPPTAANTVTTTVSMAAATAFYRVAAYTTDVVNTNGTGTLYLVVDISGGTNATTYPVSYYQTLEDLPAEVNSDTYKTTNMLMRLIPNGTFSMGSFTTELGHESDETQHTVTVTKDFYIGVFEITQRQWELVTGDRPGAFSKTEYYQTRPVESIRYYDIRGYTAGTQWPDSSDVDATSFMGKLRSKTGVATLDLPTEAQWEYACRAGAAQALNSGYDLTSTGSDPRMDEVGRYWHNGGYLILYTEKEDADLSKGTTEVGSYLPNAWGLYDMHGNVGERCLDQYGDYPSGSVTDPVGATNKTYRAVRGGSWSEDAGKCRSAERVENGHPNSSPANWGLRACCVP
jgi:formylglycine-generating enzyme required for sulfatase activity